MIVVADFLDWHEKFLAEVLQRYIKAIGWTIIGIVGIPFSIELIKFRSIVIASQVLNIKGY